jgi:hypothetical protein
MLKLGYKLMCEEHGPKALVANAQRAEAAGFEFADWLAKASMPMGEPKQLDEAWRTRLAVDIKKAPSFATLLPAGGR